MYGLTESNIKELHEILASIPHIEEAIIYGSRASGDYKHASDIDLSRVLIFVDMTKKNASFFVPYELFRLKMFAKK